MCEPAIQRRYARMARIADDYEASASRQDPREVGESRLICPRENLSVIAAKPIVLVSDSVRGIEVYEISPIGALECLGEVGTLQFRPPQDLANSPHILRLMGLQMSFVSVRDVEMPFLIDAIDAVKGQRREINEASRLRRL